MRVPAFLFAVSTLCSLLSGQAYVNYEAPHTHSIAVSADGSRLYVINTPDSRLCVFDLSDPQRPLLWKEIPLGIGPISVRPRTRDEVWVTNFVSDSISVVSISAGAVTDTIYVEDEPGDVVFAGTPERAFVSIGTNREVRVFDVASHLLLGTVPVFGDDPRSLTRSRDGKKVWVAVHKSGNGTTLVPDSLAPLPPPPLNSQLALAPKQGIIVDANDPKWGQLNVTLPDVDVVEIDTATLQVREYAKVGTILYQLAQRPGTDELWVANTESHNRVRFEPVVNGHVIDSRVTRITTGATATVTPFDLNPNINYKTLPNTAAQSTALSQPTGLEFDPTGTELFVAAFGTDRIGVVDPNTGNVVARIELGPATGSQALPRQKRGTRALAHHPSVGVLYAVNRLRTTLSVIDTSSRTVLRELGLVYDPTPVKIKEGRGFHYDAKLSGNGTMSCASCHQDGGFDGIAWDLGNPSGNMETAVDLLGTVFQMHPMKGPMLTQTFRGLKNTGPFHWRGDRRVLQDFNGAFASLLGGSVLPKADIDDFALFMESIRYAGNPNLALDRQLSTSPAGRSATDGLLYFTTKEFAPRAKCVDCHTTGTGTRRIILTGPMLGSVQAFKAPHLRNIYKRSGAKKQARGQTSGYGLHHDGEKRSTLEVLERSVFVNLRNDPANKEALTRYVEEFDTGTAPIVGYSRTANASNALSAALTSELNLMIARSVAVDCELIARGALDGEPVGFVFDVQSKKFVPDRFLGPLVSLASLRTAVSNGRGLLTFVCVPLGSGVRLGVDRDSDFNFDGDEAAQFYGTASPACAPELGIRTNSPMKLGNDVFGVVVENATVKSAAALLIGFGSSQLPIYDLNVLIDMNTSFAWSFTTNVDGVGIVPIPVPNTPALTGKALYFQALQAHACGQLGLRASRGMQSRIGN